MKYEHSTFPSLNVNHDTYDVKLISEKEDDLTYNITIKK